MVYKFNFHENIFVVLVVSEPESPASHVDALSYIPITPHYNEKSDLFFVERIYLQNLHGDFRWQK